VPEHQTKLDPRGFKLCVGEVLISSRGHGAPEQLTKPNFTKETTGMDLETTFVRAESRAYDRRHLIPLGLLNDNGRPRRCYRGRRPKLNQERDQ